MEFLRCGGTPLPSDPQELAYSILPTASELALTVRYRGYCEYLYSILSCIQDNYNRVYIPQHNPSGKEITREYLDLVHKWTETNSWMKLDQKIGKERIVLTGLLREHSVLYGKPQNLPVVLKELHDRMHYYGVLRTNDLYDKVFGRFVKEYMQDVKGFIEWYPLERYFPSEYRKWKDLEAYLNISKDGYQADLRLWKMIREANGYFEAYGIR